MVEEPVSRVLCLENVAVFKVAVIHLGRALPRASSDVTRKHRAGHPRTLPYFVLLRMGFAVRPVSPRAR